MGRTRHVLATLGVLLMVLGAGTAATRRGDGGPSHAVPTADVPASDASNPVDAAEVQKVITGLTSQILAPAGTTGDTTPVTKEQVEAQLREQLRQLGITY